MNFKKFVASLAVSTMLVGSQATISNADEKGLEETIKKIIDSGVESKSDPKVDTTERSQFMTWAPAALGSYDFAAQILGTIGALCEDTVIWPLKYIPRICANEGKCNFHGGFSWRLSILDFALIGYSILLAKI